MISDISLTCDAWQASNTNTYSAVTGHWIEECAPAMWILEQALLGFIQMNMAHNGACLSQALYKVCNCLHIVPKVSTELYIIQIKLDDLDQTYYLQQCLKQ